MTASLSLSLSNAPTTRDWLDRSATAEPASSDRAAAARPATEAAASGPALNDDQSAALDDLLATASPSPDADGEAGAGSPSIDDRLKTLQANIARMRQTLGSATYGSVSAAPAGLAIQRVA